MTSERCEYIIQIRQKNSLFNVSCWNKKQNRRSIQIQFIIQLNIYLQVSLENHWRGLKQVGLMFWLRTRVLFYRVNQWNWFNKYKIIIITVCNKCDDDSSSSESEGFFFSASQCLIKLQMILWLNTDPVISLLDINLLQSSFYSRTRVPAGLCWLDAV